MCLDAVSSLNLFRGNFEDQTLRGILLRRDAYGALLRVLDSRHLVEIRPEYLLHDTRLLHLSRHTLGYAHIWIFVDVGTQNFLHPGSLGRHGFLAIYISATDIEGERVT